MPKYCADSVAELNAHFLPLNADWWLHKTYLMLTIAEFVGTLDDTPEAVDEVRDMLDSWSKTHDSEIRE